MIRLSFAQMRSRVLSGDITVPYIVPGVLRAGPGIWFGESNVGKTRLAIATAVRVASGATWAGQGVLEGAVLYIAGEDFEGVQQRLVAAAAAIGHHEDDLPIDLIPPPSGGLAQAGAGVVVLHAAKALEDRTGCGISLVVVDTLSASIGTADPDSAITASTFMREVSLISREFGSSIVALHHPGKGGGSSMRGSQGWFDAADHVSRLFVQNGKRTLVVQKVKGAREGTTATFATSSIGLQVDNGDGLGAIQLDVQVVTDIRMEEADAAFAIADSELVKSDEPKIVRAKDWEIALEALKELFSADNRVTRQQWRDECYRRWGNRSKTALSSAFSKAEKLLRDKGILRERGDFVSTFVSEKTADGPLTKPLTVSVSVSTPLFKEGVHADNADTAAGQDGPMRRLPSKQTRRKVS